MTDKEKKRQKSWFEEFLYNVLEECSRQAIDLFIDDFLGFGKKYNYIDLDDGADALEIDEMDQWDF